MYICNLKLSNIYQRLVPHHKFYLNANIYAQVVKKNYFKKLKNKFYIYIALFILNAYSIAVFLFFISHESLY